MAPAVPVGVIFFMIQSVALVFLSGGLGSLCRFGMSSLLAPFLGRFPYATLLSNATACFLLGVLVGFQLDGQSSESRRLLLVTGFCGGFSTFSTFSYETIQLYQKEGATMMLTNVLLNLVICILCVLLGLKIVNYGN